MGVSRVIKVFAVIAAISAIFAFLGIYSGNGTKGGGTQETVTVSRGSLNDVVTAQGTLEPKDYVDVGAQISGQLRKLYVEIGDAVKKGDLIAELDPAPYETKQAADEAKLASLKAQLAEKKADLELNESLLKRAKELAKFDGISQQELDTKTASLKKSEASVLSVSAQIMEATANLESDKINVGYTKIYAPMDGIVSDQTAREGQTLNANQTTPKLVQIANLNVMTVRVQVAEADIMRLKTGMGASFSTLGSSEKKWKGAVRQILPTPEVVNDVVLYNVLIDAENNDGQLMNGMSTQVFFETAKADDVLILPTSALGKRMESEDSDKGQAYETEVKKGNKTEKRMIYVGLTTRTLAEIREGLEAGEQVVVGSSAPKPQGKRMSPPVGPRL